MMHRLILMIHNLCNITRWNNLWPRAANLGIVRNLLAVYVCNGDFFLRIQSIYTSFILDFWTKNVTDRLQHSGADLRQKASSATLPERPPLPSLLLPPLPSPLPFPSPPLRSKLPQIQLGGLGECCNLPQRGLGRSPSRNRIWCILALKSDTWWQQF